MKTKITLRDYDLENRTENERLNLRFHFLERFPPAEEGYLKMLKINRKGLTEVESIYEDKDNNLQSQSQEMTGDWLNTEMLEGQETWEVTYDKSIINK